MHPPTHQLAKADEWAASVGSGQMWTMPCCRPYYRALYGIANTLRKMSRCEVRARCGCGQRLLCGRQAATARAGAG
jgi:hypothetical protein